jgi:hypothetical protein
MHSKAAALAALILLAGTSSGQVVINEIMQDPPGSETDWEFIELYGKPGMDLTGYAIALLKGGSDPEDDGIANTPAEIDEAFTLDGLSLGADGFLVIVNDPAGDAGFFTDPAATLTSYAAQHIPTTDTAGNLANGDSSTYLLVRARPNHSISGGVSVYAPGYSFRKEPNPDSNFDGKLDFGIEGGGAEEVDPLQIVDDVAWSDNGGKEYVRSSDQEISDTAGFDPDALSRVSYFGTNPGLGHRVNGSMMVVATRSADEEFVYGEVLRLPVAVGQLPEYGLDIMDMALPKGPTDPAGPLYTCPPSPASEAACSVSVSGAFRFDDIELVQNAGLANEVGFNVTPGTFNDDARFGVTQFRFVAADFDFDGDADTDDLSLIQGRVGATLDDRINCLDELGAPIIDPGTGSAFQCYRWEGRSFNATEAMRCMDQADGPNGTNAAAVTMADLAAADAVIPSGRLCADQNNDGLVLPNDFSSWIGNFNAGDLRADVNQDGAVLPNDFSSWISAFNQGMSGPTCNP